MIFTKDCPKCDGVKPELCYSCTSPFSLKNIGLNEPTGYDLPKFSLGTLAAIDEPTEKEVPIDRQASPVEDSDKVIGGVLAVLGVCGAIALIVTIALFINRDDLERRLGLGFEIVIAVWLAMLPVINLLVRRMAQMFKSGDVIISTRIVGFLLALGNVTILSIAILSKQDAQAIRAFAWGTLLDLIDITSPALQFLVAIASTAVGLVQACYGKTLDVGESM